MRTIVIFIDISLQSRKGIHNFLFLNNKFNLGGQTFFAFFLKINFIGKYSSFPCGEGLGWGFILSSHTFENNFKNCLC